jgi:hypothetical protein
MRNLALVVVLLLNSVLLPAEATGDSATAQQTERFNELRAVRALICDLWYWQLNIEGLVRGAPSFKVEKENASREVTHFGYVFNSKQSRAIELIGLNVQSDSPLSGLTDLLLLETLVTPVEPHEIFFNDMNGALTLAPAARLQHSTCASQGLGCAGNLRIMADPQYEAFFPATGAFVGELNSEIVLVAGQCRIGINGLLKQELIISREQLDLRQKEATCTLPAGPSRASVLARNWLEAGVSYLTEPDMADTAFVSAYKLFQIANRHVEQLSPEERRLLESIIGTAKEIAAERMTPEQIEEAERQALTWAPDNFRCDGEDDPKKRTPTEEQ